MSGLPSVTSGDGPGEHTPTHVLSELKAVVACPTFTLVVLDGPDKGMQVNSQGGEIAVGTAPGNHLVLTDWSASYHHCVASVHADGFVVRDLDSTNGTFIDDVRVLTGYAKGTSALRVGRTTLGFRSDGTAVHEPISTAHRYGALVGTSPAMRRLFALVATIAKSDATTLLLGETGTGKSSLASAIHHSGPRAAEPFVVLDCAAIAPTLIESELFGHQRGAYTGADRDRVGAFEQAKGGTLLLDEIGELPLQLQPKLLRALESREIKPLGSGEPRTIACRILAASNRDLRREVNGGAFRDDLFFRLNTVTIKLPPLRERRADIPMLVRHFAAEYGAPATDFAMLIEEWRERRWPGNVRELQGAVRRAVLFGNESRDARLVSERPPPSNATPPLGRAFDFTKRYRDAKHDATAEWERAYLAALLARHGGNLSAAAREVEMDRNYLRERAVKYRLV